MRIHKSCAPHSRDTTKCTPEYLQMYQGKVVHIKQAQYFDLGLNPFGLVIAASWLFTTKALSYDIYDKAFVVNNQEAAITKPNGFRPRSKYCACLMYTTFPWYI